MRNVSGLLLLLMLTGFAAQSQNTERIKVMTYNLLNYRNTTSWCDGSNNSASQKDSYLNTIVSYSNPHVLICQEVGAQSGVPSDRILTNALNTGGVNYWQKAAYTNNSFSSLVNAAFYDTRYVELHSQSYITLDANNSSLVRVIDFYRFYYKDDLLGGLDPDTVFFTVVGCHLKAGSNTSDDNDRSAAALAAMQYIDANVPDDNVILVGDLNLNAGSSTAFQHFTNYSVAASRLYDPLNETGTWYNNYSARYIHTQSTHVNSGCQSGGGLDDRYDHILVSDEILNGAQNMEYVNNSFTVLGNDGEHFNLDITDGTNVSVPSGVLTALHGMSDHLPVTAEFDLRKMGLGSEEQLQLESNNIRVAQLTPTTFKVDWPHNLGSAKKVEFLDLNGQVVYTVETDRTQFEVELGNLSTGLYLVRVVGYDGNIAIAKFIKQ